MLQDYTHITGIMLKIGDQKENDLALPRQSMWLPPTITTLKDKLYFLCLIVWGVFWETDEKSL